ADDAFVDTQAMDMRYGEARLPQSDQDLRLALDRMSALEQSTRWLAAKDIGLSGRHQLVRRVRLAALELLDRQWVCVAWNIDPHPSRKRRLVKRIAFAH